VTGTGGENVRPPSTYSGVTTSDVPGGKLYPALLCLPPNLPRALVKLMLAVRYNHVERFTLAIILRNGISQQNNKTVLILSTDIYLMTI